MERLVVGALSDRGLLFEGARAFAGPRRLTLAIAGLPAKQPDVSEEKKGPRVGAPEKAIEGFLKSAGVTLDQCQKQSDAKGEFYVAVIERKGRPTSEVMAELLPETLRQVPLAEIHAVGRSRIGALGAAAACHCRHVRRRGSCRSNSRA